MTPDSAFLDAFIAWLEDTVLPSSILAALGFCVLLVMALAAAVWALRGVGRLVFARPTQPLGRIRRTPGLPGHRVLMGAIEGSGGRELEGHLRDALEAHLPSYTFGAHTQVFRARSPRGRPDGAVLRQARRALRKSGGDMLVWGVRRDDGPDGLVLFGVARGGAVNAEQAEPFAFYLPGALEGHATPEGQAAAYLLAKRLVPALGRPDAFRAEKIADVGSILDTLLDGELSLASGVRRELEQDFTAIALYLADQEGHADWLDKVISRRRATLEALKDDPDTMALLDARLDLGQALLKRAERQFDPVALREATVNLSTVVEALRSHDILRKAQRAADGLARAQSMVETRRRFAVNFNA